MISKPCPSCRTLLVLFTFLLFTSPQLVAAMQATRKDEPRQVKSSVSIRWRGKPGVKRYRLQVALDENFSDVIYDRAVVGNSHLVEDLPPGDYFWRVAPAAAEASAFSPPERVKVGEAKGGATNASATILSPDEVTGWLTAISDIVSLTPVKLRAGEVVDVVGLGSDGDVHALDGANGISLWTARFGGAKSADASRVETHFKPLILPNARGGADLVVATRDGVRRLRGDTGRELWRTSFEGVASGGTVADVDGDGKPEVVLVTRGPNALHLLEAETGRTSSSRKLDAEAIGSPFFASVAAARGLFVSLKSNRVQMIGADGSVVKEAESDNALTTAPVVLRRGEMSLLVVGTDKGATALSIPEMKLLGMIVSEGDAVRGQLSTADVDGDGLPEIAMLTRRGRVVLVSTIDGNVRWHKEGATGADGASFADVDGDGVLDVVVAGGNAFAHAFSGRDGSLVLSADVSDEGADKKYRELKARPLSVAPTLSGGVMVVGVDASGTALRGIEIPRAKPKTAER